MKVDAAVVGAGALGLSTALYCALLGRSVVVPDRRAPGSRASGRAAGLFKSVQGDEVRTFLARRSTELSQSPARGVDLAAISPAEAAERTGGHYHAAGDEDVAWCPEDVYSEEPGSLIDAAGAWARQVGELAGAWVAAAAVRHQLLVTSPLPEVPAGAPVTRVLDCAVYLRPARGGLMLGGFEAARSRSTPARPASRVRHRRRPAGSRRAGDDGGAGRRPGPGGAGRCAPRDGGRAPRRAVHDEPRRPLPGRPGAAGAGAVGGQRLQRIRLLVVPGDR